MAMMFKRHFLGMAIELTRKATDRNIAIGPCLSEPGRKNYFMAARGMRDVALDIDRVEADAGVDITEVRAKLLASFAILPGIKLHNVDDEGRFIQRCRELWPCKQIDDLWKVFETHKTMAKHEQAALKAARRPNASSH